MSFTVESESVARSRRNRRAAITVAVIVALLFGVFYFAASYWNTPPTKSTPAAAASCTPSAGAIKPSQITVNVYNATSRTGLAASVGRSVKARGFVLGTVANDTSKKQITGTAEIRFGSAGERAAALVQTLVAGSTLVKDTRADASVDLVLGAGYKELATATGTATMATAPPGC